MTGAHGRKRQPGGRLQLLDVIRGITLLSMIAYHGSWDLVYLAGVDWPWYHSEEAFLWQQSICWTFILLSGYCMTLSSHKWKRGALVFAAGILVTAATLVFLPEDVVVFGVLTFLGSAMLLTDVLENPLRKIPPLPGFVICALLFYVTRWVNAGSLQLWKGSSFPLPAAWYQGNVMTFLGFTEPGFQSSDYFSFFPWIFLFWCGLYLGLWIGRCGSWKNAILHINIPPLAFLGRNSLLIYLLHQPVLYMLVVLGTRYLRL